MDYLELEIVAIATSESQPNSFVVILKEKEGGRRLPVVIGGFEAQAIAIAIEGISPNRPLTHDLFKNTLASLQVSLQKVTISDLRAGVFFATLYCLTKDKKILKIDSRTSDAIALAVRFACPIYVKTFILEEAGIIFEEKTEKESTPGIKQDLVLSDYTDESLNDLLNSALKDEDYERAAEIRDELKRRTEN
ncbi:MAG: hypothetical protein DHS20C18_09620 [Saprospiraceae bacterium]|nr:MAG: hypothetical protein DHS20C18_09620 [Saprospiraceae bacterium]